MSGLVIFAMADSHLPRKIPQNLLTVCMSQNLELTEDNLVWELQCRSILEKRRQWRRQWRIQKRTDMANGSNLSRDCSPKFWVVQKNFYWNHKAVPFKRSEDSGGEDKIIKAWINTTVVFGFRFWLGICWKWSSSSGIIRVAVECVSYWPFENCFSLSNLDPIFNCSEFRPIFLEPHVNQRWIKPWSGE